MTVKSLLFGLLASVFICVICYLNDQGIRCGTLIQHLLPSVAYGGMVLFVLLINPLLRLAGRRFAFSKREIAVVLIFVLFTCGIPGWNLGSMFSCAVMQPHHFARTTPAWRSLDILSYAPPGALCDISGPKGEDIALNGFVSGLGKGDNFIAFNDVPWSAWRAPFLFWGPIILSFMLAIFGLSLVVHRQWSVHEQLPYPIVQFASSLLPDENGRLSALFRNRLFLIGFLATFLIFLNNYLLRYFPEYLIRVQLNFNLWPFSKLASNVVQGRGSSLFYPVTLFTVIGLAYFLPSEASFTMWLGPWIYCFIGGVFASYGMNLRGAKMMELVPELFIFTGGYFGILLMILYTGRQFYWSTLKRALFFRSRDDIPSYSVYGMRLFLVAILIFVFLVHLAGIHWTLGIPYTILSVMVYVGVSRILAETGAFEIGTYVYPCVFLWGVLGASALGPKVLLMMFLLSTMILSTPGWCTMPFINQGLRMADKADVPLKPLSRWGTCLTVIAIMVAIPATIFWQYNLGAPAANWNSVSAKYPFSTAIEVIQRLKAQGLEEIALSKHGFDHLLTISPDWKYVGIFILSTAIALGISYGRLKFAWWPIHPIICVFFGGHQAMKMSFSFGIGCLLKFIITKYGGGRTYQACKPLFIGLIAGTLAEELLQMIIGSCVFFFNSR